MKSREVGGNQFILISSSSSGWHLRKMTVSTCSAGMSTTVSSSQSSTSSARSANLLTTTSYFYFPFSSSFPSSPLPVLQPPPQDNQFTDVTLATETESFQAHKLILSACSPYFKKLFTQNPCKHPIVFLKVRVGIRRIVEKHLYDAELHPLTSYIAKPHPL